MPIDAKMSFIKQIENRMSDVLKVNEMAMLITAMKDILGSFSMTEYQKVDNEQDDMLNEYISAISIQGKSQKTIGLYKYEIDRMLKFLSIPTRQITVHHIRNYLTFNKNRGLAESTLENHRQIICSYFGWLRREGLIDRDPTANIGTIKVPKKEKQIYSDIDFEKLNRACESVRDRAIINFLASTGCRVGEMVRLNRDQVNFSTLECTVYGKGDKERTVYFNDVTGMLLKEYLDSRKDLYPALFAGRASERIKENAVRGMMKRLEQASGVNHVHPHKFRRTLATELTRHRMPIQEVAKVLGHETLDTTMKYVVMNNDDVKASYRRYA